MTDSCILRRNIEILETDEEQYEVVKKLYKENPDRYMSPKEWKKLRLKYLKREGKNWTK